MPEVMLNEFELQRQQLIARNRARLLALGIPEAVSGLAKLAPKQAQHKKRKAPHAAAAAEPAAPSRQSTRLRDQAMIARGEVPPDVEQGSELALFIIDGECPRCGRVLSSGHTRHLQTCKGPPEPPTEEEIAAQAEVYKSQQKDKLQQLELGGLVDYQPAADSQQQQQPEDEQVSPAKRRKTAGTAEQQQQQQDENAEQAGTEQQQKQTGKGKGKGKQSTGKGSKGAAAAAKKKQSAAAAAAAAAGDGEEGGAHATFIVIGSTGNHYVVKLSDAKRSCTCMDHRMRRRDCKHIRLIWEQLAVADAPQEWEQALQRMVSELATADAADVDMVRQAAARAAARKQKAAAAAAAATKAEA